MIAFCGTKPTERRFEEQRGEPSAGTHLSVLFSGLHFDLFIPLIILLLSYHGNRVGDFTGYSVMQVNLKLFLEMVISVSLTLRLAETLTEISTTGHHEPHRFKPSPFKDVRLFLFDMFVFH